jgi:hypothetical protein
MSGCITRTLTIESEPSGAKAFVNGRAVGTTPVSIPFRHYGVYRIEVRSEGRRPLCTEESILAPWYARFPLCLFSELLLPWRIRDERCVRYELAEARLPERDALVARAADRTE